MASGFFDRLVTRMEKLDSKSLQAQFARLAQERGFLETIFQTIQEGVMVIDNDGILHYANAAAEKMAGFDFTRAKGRSIVRILHEWDWEHLLDMADDPQDNAWARMVTREVEVTYPERRVVSVYATPFGEPGVIERGVLIILRDITSERQREASTIDNERSDAVKRLAAGVAHEIGNPLNALNIHLQLLSRELGDIPDETRRDELRGFVNVARTEVARLDAIISQFLRALRPSKPVLQAENLADVLNETLEILRSEFENRRIHVSVDLPQSIPPVLLDRSQIKQVFFNLIKNALEAMPDGGALNVAFHVTDTHLDISFCDTGAGMSADAMGRIFEPYHTTKATGTGLGLMISQRIVRDHGGEIEVSSKLGEGSCFKIRLPRMERRIRKLKS